MSDILEILAMGTKIAALEEKLTQLEKATALSTGRPMESAPKDRLILVWHDHASDPYELEAGNLTPYACHVEESFARTVPGFYLAVWGGEKRYIDGAVAIPNWWHVHDGFEEPLAPVCWWELPEVPVYKNGEK